MLAKFLTTIFTCFYYLYFLAAAESMIWLEKSAIVILTFTCVHVLIKISQFIDHGASKEKNLWPYRKLSTGFRTILIVSDTLITFIVFFGFLWIENSDEHVEDMFKYLLCFLCFFIAGVNIRKYHIRQVEASQEHSGSRFSQDFGNA